jgi:hypothetical protein
VNHSLLTLLNPDEVEVVIRLADEAAVDEMWRGAANVCPEVSQQAWTRS